MHIQHICCHVTFGVFWQRVAEDFDFKEYVLGVLEESGKIGLRPKNMDTEAFLRFVTAWQHPTPSVLSTSQMNLYILPSCKPCVDITFDLFFPISIRIE